MSDGDALTFPDAPRGALDIAITELVEQARHVLDTQGRLRALLTANQAVVEQLDLPVVLRRIVAAAVQLVDARYGAIGVISPHGDLEQFIHVGMPDEQVARIGHLPEGHGLLGALIDDPHPIRLAHLGEDPRSSGFPAEHPPMDSFLGVPIRVHGEVFGNLYLSDQKDGAFREDDEQLVIQLARTAGFAIHNARLYAETRRQKEWASAAADVTATILTDQGDDALGIIAERIRVVSDADLVSILLPTDDPAMLRVAVSRGLRSENVEGLILPRATTLSGSTISAEQPRLFESQLAADPGDTQLWLDGRVGPAMVIPFRVDADDMGALAIARTPSRPRFLETDLDPAADFALQIGVALALNRARADQQRMVVLEDRGRIARDLHDHVIQELFATGLHLATIASRLTDRDAADSLAALTGRLDDTISQIRTIIFALTATSVRHHGSVRHRILELTSDLTPPGTRPPTLTFSGPVDLVITDDFADDVVAVTREAFSNVNRHAQATSTSIDLTVTTTEAHLSITDDGRGIHDSSRRSGLANLEDRARARGGTLDITTGPTGTALSWRVPLTAHAAAAPASASASASEGEAT